MGEERMKVTDARAARVLIGKRSAGLSIPSERYR
ncbi:hypothetical protein BH24DEI1_BH24DEI1_02090 [soil metagenome]